ncbi:hypothetical protein [Deinococcus sp. UYEF24]
MSSPPRLIFSSILIAIGVVILFYAQDFLFAGEAKRSEIMALTSLVPLIWGFWLRRKQGERS